MRPSDSPGTRLRTLPHSAQAGREVATAAALGACCGGCGCASVSAVSPAGARPETPQNTPANRAGTGSGAELRGRARGVSGRALAMAASGALLVAGVVAGRGFGLDALAAALLVLSFVAGAWYVAPRAWRAIRAGSLDMNVLTTIAGAGAIAIGEYTEAAAILFLFSVAQLLEARSLDRVRRAVRLLMEHAPAQARVLRPEGEVVVPIDDVRVGDRVVIRPGERVPVDGVVVAGESEVNQASITGESRPVRKSPGASVFAGTLNGRGALEVDVTRLAGETTLAGIVRAVEEAQLARAPYETFVDRFARVYTPAVLAVAAALFVVPVLLGLGSPGEWLYRALVLLVIACPCALVISTPVTVVSALAGAARRGILVKGGAALERLRQLHTVAVDKTGTLTRGEPAVSEVVALNGDSPEAVLALAASAESRSEHLLAVAIVRGARERGLALEAPASLEALPGRGLRSTVRGTDVYVGGERLFRELGWWTPELGRRFSAMEAGGRTVVMVGGAGRPVGMIALSDELRPAAIGALAELRRLGARRAVLLTGDNEEVARTVAEQVRVDAVQAALLPEEKVQAVRELLRDGPVMFVGDGVNDAPALAASTVGVAMGGAGTDVALETADVVLMGDDLSRLPVAIRMARHATRIVRQNIAFAVASKLAFAVLALIGVATLWMAVAADMGASLLVILNGLRAVHVEDPPSMAAPADEPARRAARRVERAVSSIGPVVSAGGPAPAGVGGVARESELGASL